ncbi:MAG: hypothetical protein ACI94Y_002912 [Maribacter sp.]|jgi:hypothetical protein
MGSLEKVNSIIFWFLILILFFQITVYQLFVLFFV